MDEKIEEITPKLEEKVKDFEKEYQELLKRYNLKMSVNLDFPIYKTLPAKLQLALQIIFEENVRFKAYFEEVK